MPEAVLRRPGAVEPVLTPREKLRQAIDAFNEEQARVAALTEGQRSAQTNLWAAQQQLSGAKADLDRTRHARRQELAYAFIEGKSADTANIAAAEAAVEAAERTIQHWGDIEAACSTELAGAERRINRRQHEFNEAAADFIIAWDAFAGFMDRLDDAWKNLRSCAIVGEDLIQACHAYCPASVMSRLQRSEPLAERVGYAVDNILIENWRRAFAEFAAHNPDVQLP